MNNINIDEMIKTAREASDVLYENDLVYRTLVDNYCKSGESGNPNTLNALATYTNQLHKKNMLEMFKQINFTYEDIANMFEENILDPATLTKMIAWKFKLENDDRCVSA